MERLLIINPGSTSTKIAVFEGESPLFVKSITHTPEQLEPYDAVVEQYGFRRELILEVLAEQGMDLASFSAIVSRGGLVAPLQAGAYEVNEDMVWQLRHNPKMEHASNVGAMIAYDLAQDYKIPAYIYDGITVDEMTDINRITGSKLLWRKGLGHNLNTRAAAMRYAKESGKAYQDITVIVAHLGGGITVNLHNNGAIEDFISDDEGPFSPERAGGLPMFGLIDLCFSGEYTKGDVMKMTRRNGGLMAHLGTTDAREVEARIEAGDVQAKIVYDAMLLNVAKNIGKAAPGVCGKVDAIVLTGGIAYSKYVTEEITKRVGFIAPVVVFPGEDEMLSLALGGLRVLRGEETAGTYTKTQL